MLVFRSIQAADRQPFLTQHKTRFPEDVERNEKKSGIALNNVQIFEIWRTWHKSKWGLSSIYTVTHVKQKHLSHKFVGYRLYHVSISRAVFTLRLKLFRSTLFEMETSR